MGRSRIAVAVGFGLLGIAAGSACNAILGYGEGTLQPGDGPGGSAGATATGGTAGTGGSGATGGTAGSGGAGLTGGSGGSVGAGWLDGYGYRKPITISATAIDEPLTDFPVAVVLDADGDLAAHARDDGGDLAFTASDGVTPYTSELELFEDFSGRLAAWVRIPLLSSSTHTVLFLYYGDADAGPPSASPNTWSGAFAAVWHLSDSTGGGPPQIHDSTANDHHGTIFAALEAPQVTTGIAGDAREFDGVDDLVTIGDPADGSLDFDTGSFSYSTWVLVTTPAGGYDMPFSKGAKDPPNPGYNFELGNDDWSCNLDDGTTEPGVSFGTVNDFANQWTHLVVVVDRGGNEVRTYANGIERDSLDLTATALGSLSGDSPARIGGENPFAGVVDEVRIYNLAVTPAWVAAVYRNLATPGQFFTLGPAEPAP